MVGIRNIGLFMFIIFLFLFFFNVSRLISVRYGLCMFISNRGMCSKQDRLYSELENEVDLVGRKGWLTGVDESGKTGMNV